MGKGSFGFYQNTNEKRYDSARIKKARRADYKAERRYCWILFWKIHVRAAKRFIIDGVLAAVICIEDPLRQESAEVVSALKKAGFHKIVMMTGDSEHTAAAVANKVGVDEYYAEVLPEDKAKFIEWEKAQGKKVLMVGDGINDSPALSAADAGIAISDGAELAREIADITISADNLYQIVRLKHLSHALMKRINRNYKEIVGINTVLILLGVGGVIQPAIAAMLHNISTIMISLQSMQNLPETEEV